MEKATGTGKPARGATAAGQKILLIDNFDSFVYNVYQALLRLGCEVEVKRNNAITLAQIKSRRYGKVVISPGPGNPEIPADFGVCREAILGLGSTPVLGICLGHQGIASAFGGRIVRAPVPMHGKTSKVNHNGKGIFAGVKNPVNVMRYHSLAADEASLPDCLEITARSEDGVIMGLRHKRLPIFGVQFHPESIMTEEGDKMFANFIKSRKGSGSG